MAVTTEQFGEIVKIVGMLSTDRHNGLNEKQAAFLHAFESAAPIEECWQLLQDLKGGQ